MSDKDRLQRIWEGLKRVPADSESICCDDLKFAMNKLDELQAFVASNGLKWPIDSGDTCDGCCCNDDGVACAPASVHVTQIPADAKDESLVVVKTNGGHPLPASAVVLYMDEGNMWICHGLEFANLQQSMYSFGRTKEQALRGFVEARERIETAKTDCRSLRDRSDEQSTIDKSTRFAVSFDDQWYMGKFKSIEDIEKYLASSATVAANRRSGSQVVWVADISFPVSDQRIVNEVSKFVSRLCVSDVNKEAIKSLERQVDLVVRAWNESQDDSDGRNAVKKVSRYILHKDGKLAKAASEGRSYIGE